MEITIGIDTSCYTTSVAALDPAGNLLADARVPLTVKPGDRGLAQSEMVFQHVRNLPAVMERLRRLSGPDAQVAAIGVSVRPRPVEGSYMPVFLVGSGCAKTVGSVVNCPVLEISHQENHILAGMWSTGGLFPPEFLAVHASGGTTEIVHVRRDDDGLRLELVGGTRDLHAGQFIDRIGVALGLPFPAGPHLERLAAAAGGVPAEIPVSTAGTQISFSGPESHMKRWLVAAPEAAEAAAALQRCVAESLLRALGAAVERTGVRTVLFVGGVSANTYIREYVTRGLSTGHAADVRCPDPVFSGDNAVGAAWWALTRKVVR